MNDKDALEILKRPGNASERLAALKSLLAVPEHVSVFYAFGAPDREGSEFAGPRPKSLILEDRLTPWWEDYKRDLTRHYLDPVRRALKHSMAPVLWNALAPGACIDSADDEIWKTVRHHGIHAGLSIPLADPRARQYGSIAFVAHCERRLFDAWWKQVLPSVIGTAYLFHQGVEQNACSDTDSLTLSPREAQCLEAVARGKSSKEIAVDLRLSKRTVDLHIARASRRLGTRKRTDAVVQALLLGLISRGA